MTLTRARSASRSIERGSAAEAGSPAQFVEQSVALDPRRLGPLWIADPVGRVQFRVERRESGAVGIPGDRVEGRTGVGPRRPAPPATRSSTATSLSGRGQQRTQVVQAARVTQAGLFAARFQQPVRTVAPQPPFVGRRRQRIQQHPHVEALRDRTGPAPVGLGLIQIALAGPRHQRRRPGGQGPGQAGQRPGLLLPGQRSVQLGDGVRRAAQPLRQQTQVAAHRSGHGVGAAPDHQPSLVRQERVIQRGGSGRVPGRGGHNRQVCHGTQPTRPRPGQQSRQQALQFDACFSGTPEFGQDPGGRRLEEVPGKPARQVEQSFDGGVCVRAGYPSPGICLRAPPRPTGRCRPDRPAGPPPPGRRPAWSPDRTGRAARRASRAGRPPSRRPHRRRRLSAARANAASADSADAT